MLRTFRLLLALAVLGGMLARPMALAQTPASPPGPSPANAPADEALPGLPHPPDAPRSLMRPAPPTPPYRCDDLPEPYFVRDPLLDPPGFPQPGCFVAADLDIIKPRLLSTQTGTVQIGANAPDTLMLQSGPLDWTVAPRVQVGYRLLSGAGEFALGYRGLGTSGIGTTTGPDGTAALQNRLDFGQIDFDYLSREFSLLPHWHMKWHFGVRWVYLYYDARADEPFDVAAAGSRIFERRFSNSYRGIGPHAGVELERRFEETGLSFLGRIDAATQLGRIRQGFFETSTTPGANGGFLGGETRLSGSQDVPTLGVQVGVAWRPPAYPQAQFFLGYQYEYWWGVGTINNAGTAASMNAQAIQLRLAINF
jgi:hypothetical protein